MNACHRYNPKTTFTLWLPIVLVLVGCENFTPAPVEFDNEDVINVGDISTLEIAETVVASLPLSPPSVDPMRRELGRSLFWDPVLSGDRDVACATCHLPETGYSDGRTRSIGVGGVGRGKDRVPGTVEPVKRNSQSLLNVAWNGINELGLFSQDEAPMFWDNRVQSLKKQALEPLISREEMRGDNFSEETILSEVLSRLNDNSEYVALFKEAYGVDAISAEQLVDALSSFQTTLIANNSRFDQWMRGDATAMTEREISGMQEFVLAGCAACHSGPMFSDFELHVLGTPEGENLAEPDSGNGEFAFRTPALRQLAFTAPYFHAGQFGTLSQAINFYDEPNGSSNASVAKSELDPDFLALPEMDDGRGSIIQSFLEALNDSEFDRGIPERVPSGLSPGGSLDN